MFIRIFIHHYVQGRGIIHAEMPVYEQGAPDPRGLQLWVDLPKQVCWSE